MYPAKGVHVLLEAFHRRAGSSMTLDIYGIVQERQSEEYTQRLQRRAANDPRVRFLPQLPNREVVSRLKEYDVLAVPSQWMETGPLVVYDAFSAGIPVVGSNRGGIAELVCHEQNGLLVETSNVNAWEDALDRLTNEQGLLDRLRAGVSPPRTMTAVAAEMADLYSELLNETQSSKVLADARN
jgi:glycosyltransferase involved in cell wall biosynthesis